MTMTTGLSQKWLKTDVISDATHLSQWRLLIVVWQQIASYWSASQTISIM